MKYVGYVICMVLPGILFAQVERIVSPGGASTDADIEYNQALDSQRSYFEAILVDTTSTTTKQDTAEQTDERTSTTSDMNSTTTRPNLDEIVEVSPVLSDRVNEINNRYEAAEANCTTGTWLENIWCTIKWW